MKVFNTLTEETLEDTYKTNSSSRNVTDYKDYNFTKGKPSLKTNNFPIAICSFLHASKYAL